MWYFKAFMTLAKLVCYFFLLVTGKLQIQRDVDDSKTWVSQICSFSSFSLFSLTQLYV